MGQRIREEGPQSHQAKGGTPVGGGLAVIGLVWLWISNIAILLGAEFNAELERGRLIEGGHPADREPFVEPRDTRKMKREKARA